MSEKIKEIRIIKEGALKQNGKIILKEFTLHPDDIEEDLAQMHYDGQGLIKDRVVENAKLPSIIHSFYLLVFENEKVPTFNELIAEYKKNFTISGDNWSIGDSSFSIEGVTARVQRAYPSLIRDVHFLAMCFRSDYFDDVRYSLADDYKLGIDLRIRYDEFDYNLALHLESKRGNFYKTVKYNRHNYDKAKEIVLTLSREEMKKASNFHLYTHDHVDRLLNHIQSKIEAEVKLKLPDLKSVPFPEPSKPKFTYIDLFAGIGGFHLALNNLGGKCVYSSEWDLPARKTYYYNYGILPEGDITNEANKQAIPENFDLLCAGFPCQAFSIAGRRGGFEDTRGTLFFDVADIIKRRRPKALFLENVKGLFNHDQGRTLSTILNTLREDLDYYVPDSKILNAKDFGVPQNRERIFIVGFRKDLDISEFEYPRPTNDKETISHILEEEEVSVKYYLSTQYLETLRKHKARHASKGNGFGYEIKDHDEIANAVVCGGMGRERNLIIDNRLTNFTPVTKIKGEVNREGIRKMTPREWARLQGFPDNFVIPVSDVQAYKQFGNSVAVPAIEATAKQILRGLNIM